MHFCQDLVAFAAILGGLIGGILLLFLFYRRPTDPLFWVAWPVKQQIKLASPDTIYRMIQLADRNNKSFTLS